MKCCGMAVKRMGKFGVMCDKHKGTDCEDGALTFIRKGVKGSRLGRAQGGVLPKGDTAVLRQAVG
jgi:hypothetical protein